METKFNSKPVSTIVYFTGFYDFIIIKYLL